MATPDEQLASAKRAILRDMTRQALLYPRVHRAVDELRTRVEAAAPLPDAQSILLDRLLEHAVTSVPYYRRTAPPRSCGESPFAWLARFQPIDKPTVRENFADLCDDEIDPARCQMGFTSGTSGVPVRIVLDDDHLVAAYAGAILRNAARGLGYHRKVLMPHQNWLPDWFEYTAPAHGLARVAEFGTALAETDAAGLARRLTGYLPDVVFGHPSSCRKLADFAGTTGIAPIRPVAVVTFGETLLSAARMALRESFQAPVFDDYGMREFGTIASECGRGNYHIDGERLWVEVMDDDARLLPDGETGEIVVTGLVNRSMPLIRYRTGDIGALAVTRCTCGDRTKCLTLVEGRRLNLLRLPDDRVVEVGLLARVVRSFPVERFQIVAVSPGLVRVLAFGNEGLTDVDLRSVAAQLRVVLDHSIEVEVVRSAMTDFVSAGKRKHVDFVDLT